MVGTLTTPSDVEQHRTAVEGLHGGEASFERTERVVETHEGETVWEGDIYLFGLSGHPTANRCYAWSEPVPGSDRRRFFAVLQQGPVDSPEKAVRAAIVSKYRESRDG